MDELTLNPSRSLDQPNGVDPSDEILEQEWMNQNSDGSANEITNPAQSVEPAPTLSDYMKSNPDLSYEDYMKFMSQHSEEWAEKYLDYLTEKGELDRANAYTAQREDTAYQRLVQDLSKAGFNPAMLYSHNANISASGSQGYIKMTEGANSRAVGNYSKIQKILIAYMLYGLGVSKTVLGSLGDVIKTIFG